MFDVWIGDVNLAMVVLIFTHVVMLPVQLLLCFKVKRLVLRLLPAGISALAAAVCGIMCCIVTGWDVLAWLIFLIYAGIMLGVCLLAWGIWAIVRLIQKKKPH